MRNLLKSLGTLCLSGITALFALFTIIYSLGTILTWNESDVGSKIAVVVFIIIFLFLAGLTGTLLESMPKSSSKKVKDMTGLEFEHYCAEWLMKKNNFKKVVVTPPSGDYGADIIAYDKKGDRWVFQCKHYNGKVNNTAVQEAVTAKAHYKAAKAAVMTNSKLTEKARQLAFENEVLLYELLSD